MHSAAPQALGYLYQVEIALYLLMKEDGCNALSIEHIDDVVFLMMQKIQIYDCR